jgi:hypothetical protein
MPTRPDSASLEATVPSRRSQLTAGRNFLVGTLVSDKVPAPDR